jgi:hypothetical protein
MGRLVPACVYSLQLVRLLLLRKTILSCRAPAAFARLAGPGAAREERRLAGGLFLLGGTWADLSGQRFILTLQMLCKKDNYANVRIIADSARKPDATTRAYLAVIAENREAVLEALASWTDRAALRSVLCIH